jgi:hypothetical protein
VALVELVVPPVVVVAPPVVLPEVVPLEPDIPPGLVELSLQATARTTMPNPTKVSV